MTDRGVCGTGSIVPKQHSDGTYRDPKALRHLRRTFTEDMARRSFAPVFGRPPESDDALERFVEHFTLEMYNGGFNE